MYVDITDGDCGCSSVSDRSFLLLSMGIWLSLTMYTVVLYHNDDCRSVYDVKVLGV